MATVSQCERALDEFEEDLGRRRNVVGLGIVPSEEGKRSAKDWVVAVYVKQKVPANELSGNDLIPKTLKLSGQKGGVEVPTRVIEQGTVQLETLK
jgi:hypothetical protein